MFPRTCRSIQVVTMILCSVIVAPPIMAQEVSGIESMMSEKERSATGIEDLSDTELRALNSWLRQQGMLPATRDITDVEEPVVESEPGNSWGQRENIADVVSVIEGEFSGWDGKTIFNLANGQVYQQRRPGRWKTSLNNPEVRVTKGIFGFDLEVEGHSIGVRRIR